MKRKGAANIYLVAHIFYFKYPKLVVKETPKTIVISCVKASLEENVRAYFEELDKISLEGQISICIQH